MAARGRGWERGHRHCPSVSCLKQPSQSAAPEAALAFQGERGGEGAASCQHPRRPSGRPPPGPSVSQICRVGWGVVFSLYSYPLGVLRGAWGGDPGEQW